MVREMVACDQTNGSDDSAGNAARGTYIRRTGCTLVTLANPSKGRQGGICNTPLPATKATLAILRGVILASETTPAADDEMLADW